MRKICLFILLLVGHGSLLAASSPSPLDSRLSPFIEKATMHEYALRASELTQAGDYLRAADVYRQALSDTVLRQDSRTALAMELAALYNDHLQMHQAAWKLIETHTFTSGYVRSWVRDVRRAQTLLYLKRYEEARPLLDSLLTQHPLYDLYATRGYGRMATHEYNGAMSDLQQALEGMSEPLERQRLRSNIALVQAQLGLCAEAVETIDSCLTEACSDKDKNIYLRKRAQIHLVCGDTTSAADDYKQYWQGEKTYLIDHFARMTRQQQLDHWSNRKPLISGAFRLRNHAAPLLADIALFRHQAALLGVRDTTPELIRQRMSVTSQQVRQALKAKETAIEFVKYPAGGEWWYAAVVTEPAKTEFVPLWSEQALNTFPVGRSTLVKAVCSTTAADKNRIYTSDSLAQFIWQPLMPYLQDKEHVYFAADGLLHLLAIEYLLSPLASSPSTLDSRPTAHRLSSTGLLAEKRTKTKELTALLVGGLDYNEGQRTKDEVQRKKDNSEL